MLIDFILYIILGSIAGFSAGLFGLGGGLTVVPGLLWIFIQLHFPDSMRMQMAQGCSLAAMLFTSSSSAYRHNKLDNIIWPVFKKLVGFVIFGVIIGACLAWWLHGFWLTLIFSLYLLIIIVKMILVNPKTTHANSYNNNNNISYYKATASIIGIAAGLLGVGGGTFCVPFLSGAKLNLKNAIGTSSALTVPVAIVGTIAYIIFGYLHQENPHIAWSSGFVYWPAVICVGCFSAIFAQIGAKVTDLLPTDKLKKYFAGFIILIFLSLTWHLVQSWPF